MRPAESLLDIRGPLFRESDTGLVVPWRILQPAVFVQGFVDYIPGENLASVVLHHRDDMFLQQARQLGGCEMAVGKPLRIVMVPNQAVSADLHVVSLREADDFIGLAEVEGSCVLRTIHHFIASSGSTMLNSRASVAE